MLNNDDGRLDLDNVQEDAHYCPLLGVMTSLTSSLPSSSLISSPSGLAVDMIVWLTHDELHLNPEFMKHIHMVDALQELLGLQEKTSMHAFFFSRFGTANSLLALVSGSATTVSSMAVSLDCSSLRLSESVSQVSLLKANTSHPFCPPQGQPFPYPRPLICVEFYPPSILWTLTECKMDPTVSTSEMNKSCPSMKHAL